MKDVFPAEYNITLPCQSMYVIFFCCLNIQAARQCVARSIQHRLKHWDKKNAQGEMSQIEAHFARKAGIMSLHQAVDVLILLVKPKVW